MEVIPSVTRFEDLDSNKLYTYADYLTWQFKERVELIKGTVFKKGPAPSSYQGARQIALWFGLCD